MSQSVTQPNPEPTENSTFVASAGVSLDESAAEAFARHAKVAELKTNVQRLLTAGKQGAHWFYWVAGLSLVNSLIMLGGGQIHFVVGLGVTALTDAVAVGIAQQNAELGPVVKGIAIVFAVAVSSVVALLGWLSAKRYTVVMGIGMVLYLVDGLLILLLGSTMSAAFHAFALFWMWNGLRAYWQLAALEESLASPSLIVAGPAARIG